MLLLLIFVVVVIVVIVVIIRIFNAFIEENICPFLGSARDDITRFDISDTFIIILTPLFKNV